MKPDQKLKDKDTDSIDLKEPTPCAVDMNIPNKVPVKTRQPEPIFEVPMTFERVDSLKKNSLSKRLSNSLSDKLVKKFRE